MKSIKSHLLSATGIAACLLLSLAGCEQEEVLYQYEEVFGCEFNPSSEYIIVLGDMQEYTQNPKYAQYYYMATINWIRGMKKQGYKIDCVLHTGDVTNGNEDWQYKNFYNVTRPLAEEVMFISAVGNHDYDWTSDDKIENRRSSKLTRYASFDLTCKNIVARFERDRLDNIVVQNTIHGQRYDILVLEFGPRPEVVTWADQWVRSNPDHNFILLTHEFLEYRGWRVSTGHTGAERQFVTIPCSTPEYIWNHLIHKNNNIRCVVCGHNGFSQLNLLPNETGRMVPQIMFNVQYLPNGGNGMLEIWEIPKNSNKVKADVYSAKENLPYTEYVDSIFDYHKAHFSFEL